MLEVTGTPSWTTLFKVSWGNKTIGKHVKSCSEDLKSMPVSLGQFSGVEEKNILVQNNNFNRNVYTYISQMVVFPRRIRYHMRGAFL